ncbi:MAG: flagellar basal body L-ring protein FlgH [Pirellulales bacterium]|nr:flagellar basal body L-ring protein FlgH [Pirellulales bacterium]
MRYQTLLILTLGLCGGAAEALAQSSSLYVRSTNGVIPQASASLIYSELLQPRQLKINDLVTIRVIEAGEFSTRGRINRQNNANIDARLRNWIELDGLNLISSPNTDLPRARGSYNVQNQSQGELRTSEELAFNITARVVDVRPNGLLVLEAHKTVRIDDEIYDNSLTGIVRPEDVGAKNLVTSDKIAELSIQRRTVGQVRDSYRRGWLSKFWDQVTPF